MAKECALCGAKSMGMKPLSFEMKDVMICKECFTNLNTLRNAEVSDPNLVDLARKYADTKWIKLSSQLKTYVDDIVCSSSDPQGYREAKAERLEELKQNMVLTTATSIDGYHIIRQGGLVFGDTIFKSSALKSLSSDIIDIGNSLSVFSSKEMSGITSMLKDAREFAINKMIEEAAERDCNAIIGIDSESSAGDSSLIHVTVYGTAVYIEK